MNFKRGKLVRFKGSKEKLILISLSRISFLGAPFYNFVEVFDINDFSIEVYDINLFEEIKEQNDGF